ncbi:MAG: FAD-binding oxidoreductase [Vicinamibacterales bacterium]
MASDVSSYLEDAAHFPGGHSAGVLSPRTTDEVAEALAGSRADGAILAVGAQSSLTGGATPMGETVLSTSQLTRIDDTAGASITVGAGVTIAALQQHLAVRGAWFPPAPTYTGAFAGGIVATNAAGAATFKYGSTREWVEGLTVVLASGQVLPIRRGEYLARAGTIEIPIIGRIPAPAYTMPAVRKISAGYFASPDLDLVDLFIGSEGTLGIVTEVTFRVLSPAPQLALALVPCSTEAQAFQLVSAIREASSRTWATADAKGIDACAVENMDRRYIEVIVADGAAARNNVMVPGDTAVVLLVTLELPAETTAARAYDEIASATGLGAPDSSLVRFCGLLRQHDVLDGTELALASDRRRFEQLIAIREAVPSGINHRVGVARSTIDPRIAKTAADMVVPFEHFGEMMDAYRRGFESRGLDYAIWGHISDGNVHPNVIPRSYDDVQRGMDAILEFGREAARLGGCPLAEHGVGRSPVKQQLLHQLYGDAGIAQMRAVKRALDPDCKLAPGVIFARE